MIRSILAWLLTVVAAVCVVFALLLWQPADVFEMLVGFAAGTLGSAQFALLAVAITALVAGVLLMGRQSVRYRRVAMVTGAAAVVVGMLAVVRDRANFSRSSVTIQSAHVTLEGTVYRPRSEQGKRPAILILHGSGPIRRDAYHLFARRFAARGFVVLNVDKRGVGGSGGSYSGDNLGRPVIQGRAKDARAALDFLTTQPDVDTARVGVFSMSQGGWVVPLLLDGQSPARFGIVFSGVAVSSAEEGLWSDWSGEDNDHFGFKPPATAFDEMDRRIALAKPGDFNPRDALAHMTAPTLWMFGEWDSSAPTAASVRVLDSLQQQHIPIVSHVFPEANHGLMIVRGPRGKRNANFVSGLWDSVFAWTDLQRITNDKRD